MTGVLTRRNLAQIHTKGRYEENTAIYQPRTAASRNQSCQYLDLRRSASSTETTHLCCLSPTCGTLLWQWEHTNTLLPITSTSLPAMGMSPLDWLLQPQASLQMSAARPADTLTVTSWPIPGQTAQPGHSEILTH